MESGKLALVIMWHQHQPYYKSGEGVYQMPWVRFHSTKDYVDMLRVLEEFPDIKQNINLVPSLLAQVQDYVENRARDNILMLTEKPANQLTLEDKKKILDNFFLANVDTMIKPYLRYRELFLKFKDLGSYEAPERQASSFNEQEYRDLQVWYNLTWIGMESRKRPRIARLFKKGQGFSENDKKMLVEEIYKIMGEVVPLHKKLWYSGQIELSTTPFYHPILPLLCDNYIARESAPGVQLPRHHFVHPEDAEAQVVNGLRYFESLFGRLPQGMWPAEGSVSVEALKIIVRNGIRWVATDEGILAHTLKQEFNHLKIYQPYLLTTGEARIHVFFRDHYLSDAIGFVYSKWATERAVNDFIQRIHAIRKMLVDRYGEEALNRFVVPIILDGENCWEYYPEDGKPFLRALYGALSEDPFIETTTFQEVLQRAGDPPRLTHIHPGSWINSNFDIWIGSEEDNKSWDILTETRNFLEKEAELGLYSPEVLRQAWEKIYIAEGSDWNWWYGDEHSSANDLEFDQLYRQHLMEVYHLLGRDVPTVLYQTIKRVHFDRFVSTRPKNFVHPVLDGKSTHFYEWVGAAVYDVSKTPQTAMHQTTRLLDKIYVGFDAGHLYLRVDFLQRPDPLTEFIIAIKRPRHITLVVSPLRGVLEKYEPTGEFQKKENLPPTFKLNQVLEVAVPFDKLQVKPGEILGFQFRASLNNQPLEVFPHINLIEIEVPDENFELVEWSV